MGKESNVLESPCQRPFFAKSKRTPSTFCSNRCLFENLVGSAMPNSVHKNPNPQYALDMLCVVQVASEVMRRDPSRLVVAASGWNDFEVHFA